MSNRKQINAAVLGTNGVGKTSRIIEIIRLYLKIDKPVLICVSDDAEAKLEDIPLISTIEEIKTFTGVAKIIVEDVSFFNEFREAFLKNKERFGGCLILDDARLFLSSRDEPVLKLMRKRRQLNVDIYSIFHAFDGETPPSYWPFVTRVILFKTFSDYKKSLAKMDGQSKDLIIKAIDRINAEYGNNPYVFEEVVLRDELAG